MPGMPRLSWDAPAPGALVDQLARLVDCLKCGNPVDPQDPQPCEAAGRTLPAVLGSSPIARQP